MNVPGKPAPGRYLQDFKCLFTTISIMTSHGDKNYMLISDEF